MQEALPGASEGDSRLAGDLITTSARRQALEPDSEFPLAGRQFGALWARKL